MIADLDAVARITAGLQYGCNIVHQPCRRILVDVLEDTAADDNIKRMRFELLQPSGLVDNVLEPEQSVKVVKFLGLPDLCNQPAGAIAFGFSDVQPVDHAIQLADVVFQAAELPVVPNIEED